MVDGNSTNPLLIQTPQQRDFMDGHLQTVVKTGSEIASESCMPHIDQKNNNEISRNSSLSRDVTLASNSESSSSGTSGSSEAYNIKKQHKFSQSFVDQIKDLTTINYGLFTVFIVFVLLHVMPPLSFLVHPKTQRRVLWKVCVTSLVAGVIVYILSLIRLV